MAGHWTEVEDSFEGDFDPLECAILRSNGYILLEYTEILGGNSGAWLIEYQDNYYWLPHSITQKYNYGKCSVWVYGKTWASILATTPPDHREKYSIWV